MKRKKKTKLDLKKDAFQKFCTDEFNKCVERIRKRMQKDEVRVGSAYDYMVASWDKHDIKKQVFANDVYLTELEWSPYYIIGKLVSGHIDYENDKMYGDIKYNIIHKDEIIKKIGKINEDYKKRSAKNEEYEFKEYQRLKKKFKNKKG